MIDILAVLLGNGVMSCEDPSQMLQMGAHAVWNPRKLIHEKEVKDHCHFFKIFSPPVSGSRYVGICMISLMGNDGICLPQLCPEHF